MRLAWIVVAACSSASRSGEPVRPVAVRTTPTTASPAPTPAATVDVAAAPRGFDAAANVLAEPTHGCTAKSAGGKLQLRCPLDQIIDVGDTRGEIVGGVFTIDGTTLDYTSEEAAMKHNTYLFEDGAFELATRTSDGKREWYLDGTWKPGGAAAQRRVITCCEEHRPALACLGQQFGAAITQCQAKRDCAALDACVQTKVAAQHAKACAANDPFNCR